MGPSEALGEESAAEEGEAAVSLPSKEDEEEEVLSRQYRREAAARETVFRPFRSDTIRSHKRAIGRVISTPPLRDRAKTNPQMAPPIWAIEPPTFLFRLNSNEVITKIRATTYSEREPLRRNLIFSFGQ